jgi:hypothetical protein
LSQRARQVSWLTAAIHRAFPRLRVSVAYCGESFAANSCGGSPGFEDGLSPDSLFVALEREPMHGCECVWRRLALSISIRRVAVLSVRS